MERNCLSTCASLEVLPCPQRPHCGQGEFYLYCPIEIPVHQEALQHLFRSEISDGQVLYRKLDPNIIFYLSEISRSLGKDYFQIMYSLMEYSFGYDPVGVNPGLNPSSLLHPGIATGLPRHVNQCVSTLLQLYFIEPYSWCRSHMTILTFIPFASIFFCYR